MFGVIAIVTSLLVLILKGEHSKIKRKHQLEQLRLKQQQQQQQGENTKLVGETPSESEKLNPYKPTIEVPAHHPEHEFPRPSFRQIGKIYRLIFSILFLKPILKLIVIFLTVRVK